MAAASRSGANGASAAAAPIVPARLASAMAVKLGGCGGRSWISSDTNSDCSPSRSIGLLARSKPIVEEVVSLMRALPQSDPPVCPGNTSTPSSSSSSRPMAW